MTTLPAPSRLDTPKPKRVGPPLVAPFTCGSLRFEALHWGRDRGLGQNGGYLVALDADSGRELWTARVYAIDYRGGLETDVQDLFIRCIAVGSRPGTLLITDERDRCFEFDIDQRQAVPSPQ